MNRETDNQHLISDTASDPNPGFASIVSPQLDLKQDHCLTFYYHLAGANIGYLNVSDSVGSGQSVVES